MKNKVYLKYLISILVLFLSYHAIVWIFFTSKIFALDNKTSIGDLSRTSYQLDMSKEKKLKYTLPQSFIYDKIFHNQQIDMITVGDSFSHGGGYGKNPYYQDYLASAYNQNILNVNPIRYDQYIETIAALDNSGYLKKNKIKYILIQSVERFVTIRFSKDVNYSKYNLQIPKISKKNFSINHQEISIINTANYKLPYYYFAYKFKENPKRDVYKLKLTKKLFSNHTNILIFGNDINNIPKFTKKSIAKANEALNKLANSLKKDDIKLIFMPTVDKYDLYYDYIKDNHYPKNPFFDLIRPLKKEYIFIDTKAILAPLLKKMQKDIYYVDDTHWSYKASKTVINNQAFKGLFEDK